MPVRGTLVTPSPDTGIPEPDALLSPILSTLSDEEREMLPVAREHLIPIKPRYYISQLSEWLGGSIRSWQRECELGNLEAIRLPGGWAVSCSALLRYLRARHNLMSMN
jgi:hypothetical protein